jgi:hypothetical protein
MTKKDLWLDFNKQILEWNILNNKQKSEKCIEISRCYPDGCKEKKQILKQAEYYKNLID